MSQAANIIECPHCHQPIDVQEILHHQVNEELKKEYEAKLAKQQAMYQAQQDALSKREQALEQQRREQEQALQQRLQVEKKALEQSIKQRLQTEQSESMQQMQAELAEKSKALIEFNKIKADIARLEREKEEQRAAIEAQLAEEFNARALKEQTQLKEKLTHEFTQQQTAQLQALQQELSEKSAQLTEFNKAKAEIARLEREKDEQRAAIEAELAQKMSEQFKREHETLRQKLAQELAAEQQAQVVELEKQISEKSEQLKELNRTKADVLRLEREKDELKEVIALEKEREFTDKLREERLKIQKQSDDSANLKLRELQKQLDEQKQLAEEMKRKAEQGSTQLQGEVQELAIEEWLRQQFPIDIIQEIKKGERGADCLQLVHSKYGENCGTIYYESKRAKNFQPAWIEKFKDDIREKNPTTAVLVTETLPAGMERMGLKDKIWICTFEEFKSLSAILREWIIKLKIEGKRQENKGEKKEMLYDYLTSNEFRLQVEAIVEGFSQMQADLDAEKRAMARIWKQREKQLEKVLINTTNMHGAIRGIAGNAIQPVAQLELGGTEDLFPGDI